MLHLGGEGWARGWCGEGLLGIGEEIVFGMITPDDRNGKKDECKPREVSLAAFGATFKALCCGWKGGRTTERVSRSDDRSNVAVPSMDLRNGNLIRIRIRIGRSLVYTDVADCLKFISSSNTSVC